MKTSLACEICGKQYVHAAGLKRHMSHAHLPPVPGNDGSVIQASVKDSQRGSYSSELVAELLQAAKDKRNDDGYPFSLNGDLNQMGLQKAFLQKLGFDVGQRDIYPCLRTEEDFKRAIRLFFTNDVEGWWGYPKQLLEYSICTLEELKQRLEKAGIPLASVEVPKAPVAKPLRRVLSRFDKPVVNLS